MAIIGDARPVSERAPGALRRRQGDSPPVVPISATRSPAEPARLQAEIEAWRPVLHLLQFPEHELRRVAGRAQINATSVEAELLASGLCDERAFYRALAHMLGIEYLETVDPGLLVMRDRDGLALLRDPRGARLARIMHGAGRTRIVLSPDADQFQRLLARRDPDGGLGSRLCIIAPSQLRAAIEKRCEYLVMQRATGALFEALPYCSSRIVLTGLQGLVAGGFLALLAAALLVAPQPATLLVHTGFSLFFFACVALRLAAIPRSRRSAHSGLQAFDPADMPRYSVLVALYREREMVPELLQALGKLAWPRTKLEIKLVCEADDRETIAALQAHGLRPWVEIIQVPRGFPRTKPKALAHALQLCTGELVVLYDAEDKPHPWQLVEAWQRFAGADSALACVQAPLAISNGGSGIVARMFAFEYSGLFRGMLPFLSDRSLIIPLGGTSNHFRRAALEKMGGWDPYNVTEDADLGLRMRRFGYRTETISYPTYEIAPENWTDWLHQRTRWFKGWIQTRLVHMRDPRRLAAELGFRSFLVSQILFAGMVASALVHPILILTIAWLVVSVGSGAMISPIQHALAGLDLANIMLGYTAFFLLGRSTLKGSERKYQWQVALFTPAYWFMQSVAAWRAVLQLWRDPHLWEKTPHPARPGDAGG